MTKNMKTMHFEVGQKYYIRGKEMTVGYTNAGMAWLGEERYCLTEKLDAYGFDRTGERAVPTKLIDKLYKTLIEDVYYSKRSGAV